MEFHKLIIVFCFFKSACAAVAMDYDNISDESLRSLNIVKRDVTYGKLKKEDENFIKLPTYSVYIIGFLMVFMLIAIIMLLLILCVKNKREMFKFNIKSKQYVRQESTGVTPLYNNFEDHNQTNGSTLTMNSGMIEICEPRVSDPTTPTRLEDSKIIFTKKPLKPIVPVIHRGQIDAICKEVLRKVQKSDSASFRDLNELLSGNVEKHETTCDVVNENEEDKKPEQKTEEENKTQNDIEDKTDENESKRDSTDDITIKTAKEKIAEINKKTINELKNVILNKNAKEKITDGKNETTIEPSIEPQIEPKNEVNTDVKIEVDNVKEEISIEISEEDTDSDAHPSPVKLRHSNADSEYLLVDNTSVYDMPPSQSDDGQPVYDMPPRRSDVESMPLYDMPPNQSEDDKNMPVYDMLPGRSEGGIYDMPPRRSKDGEHMNFIQLDHDSQYLLALSKDKTDSCYINAKKLP